ncbi:MAG: FAD-dependent oxidoreductase, partial [Anaerolineae bacterium]|nr:FAD-dependent oxidoreductase [Anaerolineae bacterium]
MWVRHRIRPVLVPAQEEMWVLGAGGRVRYAGIGSAIRGSWIPAPLHYLGLFGRPRFLTMLSLRDIASLFRVFATLLAALSIDPLAEDQPLYDWKSASALSLADVCKGWSPNMTSMFTGLSRNALPAAPSQIPASGFFAFLRFYTLRRRDAWAFSYFPDESDHAVIRPLVEVLRAHGGEIQLGARVIRLERTNEGWCVTWEQGGEQESRGAGGQGMNHELRITRATGDCTESQRQPPVASNYGSYSSNIQDPTSRSTCARHVILATDAAAAGALLADSPDTAAGAARLRLPSTWPTAVVRLWFDRQPVRSRAARGDAEAGMFSGDFVLDNFFWLHRIYNDYIVWSRETGGSALESHIYGPPELLVEPDAALLARAIVDATRAWPELRGHIIHSVVTRNEATHTLLHAGRPEEHLGVVTPWSGLYCCGDWVRDANPAMFMERACVTGIKAANAVLDSHGLEPWPLLHQVQPEPLAWLIEIQMRHARTWLRERRSKSKLEIEG